LSDNTFLYDAFLSHSSKDKPIVRKFAEKLTNDGFKVWFDEINIEIGDSIPLKLEEGIERSRVLLIFMSKDFFASDWTKMEHYAKLFDDPINKGKSFIPVLISDCEIPKMLNHFKYLDWRKPNKKSYEQLVQILRNLKSEHNKETNVLDLSEVRKNTKERNNWLKLLLDHQ